MNRKVRCDRIHLIYRIDNVVTGDFYIGLTRRLGRANVKSLKERLRQHVSRAARNEKDYTICRAIREHGAENFKISLVEAIRGKAPAHVREVELVDSLNPSLNMLKKSAV